MIKEMSDHLICITNTINSFCYGTTIILHDMHKPSQSMAINDMHYAGSCPSICAAFARAAMNWRLVQPLPMFDDVA